MVKLGNLGQFWAIGDNSGGWGHLGGIWGDLGGCVTVWGNLGQFWGIWRMEEFEVGDGGIWGKVGQRWGNLRGFGEWRNLRLGDGGIWGEIEQFWGEKGEFWVRCVAEARAAGGGTIEGAAPRRRGNANSERCAAAGGHRHRYGTFQDLPNPACASETFQLFPNPFYGTTTFQDLPNPCDVFPLPF